VLPSKERCPYLVVVEVLEQPYSCDSPMLYSHGYEAVKEMLAHRLRTPTTDGDTVFSHSEPSVAREVDLATHSPPHPTTDPTTEQFYVDDDYFNNRPMENENVAAFARPDFHPIPNSPNSDPSEEVATLSDNVGDISKDLNKPLDSNSCKDILRGGKTPKSHNGESFHGSRDYWEPSITVNPPSTPQEEPLLYPPYNSGEYAASNQWVRSESDQLYPYHHGQQASSRLDVFDNSNMNHRELQHRQQHVPVRKKTWAERRDIVRHARYAYVPEKTAL